MRIRLGTLLSVLVIGLAACGGDGGGGSDEDQIRELVKTFYANGEGVCDKVTDKLLEGQFESKEECEKSAEEAEPEEDYEIEDVSTDGDEGEVDVKAGDQTGTLVVKKENGDWKVDSVKSQDSEETGTTPGE